MMAPQPRRSSASLVVYKTDPAELQPLLHLLGSCGTFAAWIVVDNGAADGSTSSESLRLAVEQSGGVYVAATRNLGFGAGHNLAFQHLATVSTEFHLLVNPDILFEPAVPAALEKVMDHHPSAATLMPRVVYPDGAPQFLCRLLPTPFDFALRRFFPAPLQRLFQGTLDRYELRGLEDVPCNCVPFLSGCFMFTRRSALQAIHGFDDRFFLYLEDVDLCRRLATVGDLLYWPAISVVHGCYRGAYRDTRLMLIFVQSAVRYFNKWGWFFDRRRRRANQAALYCLPPTRT